VRTVVCDFCEAALIGHAWDCPCQDFDYSEQRMGLEPGAPVIDGSIGSWLACDACARCVRDGDREELLTRAVVSNYGPGGKPRSFAIPAALVDDLRSLHDQFWVHRRIAPTHSKRSSRRCGRCARAGSACAWSPSI